MSAWRARLARTVTTSNLHAFVSVSVGLAERLSGVRLVQPDHERVLHRPLRRGARGPKVRPGPAEQLPAVSGGGVTFPADDRFPTQQGRAELRLRRAFLWSHWRRLRGVSVESSPPRLHQRRYHTSGLPLRPRLRARSMGSKSVPPVSPRHLQAVRRRPQLHRVPAHAHHREDGQRKRLRVRVRAGVRIRKRRVQDMHGQLLQNRIQRAPVPDLPRKRLDSPRC
jgi:hypothetical protein